ncbi:MAG: hypothetical protein RIC52_15270 [Amphiplicatus sp.]
MRAIVFLLCAIFFWAAGNEARASLGDCRAPGYVAAFDARLGDSEPYGAERCREIATFEINNEGRRVKMRVLEMVGDSGGDNSQWITYVGALASAISGPLHAMGQLDLSDVSVMLTSLEYVAEDGERAHATAQSPHPNECFITFYKEREAITVEKFVFTYAHELFHCIQQKTWGPRATYAASMWWVEGSAEYFANLVQMGTEYSDGYYADFDNGSVRESLLDMTYENVVFFLWLGQERDPAGVRIALQAMPDTDVRDDHFNALRSIAPLDDWNNFAEDYMNGDIRQPGGRAVPRAASARAIVNIASARAIPLTASAYVLARYGYNFVEGKTYKLRLDAPDMLRMQMAEHSGLWQDPPARVLACDEDKAFRVLVLTVEDEASGTLVVDDPEELDQRACCLIGDWAPTGESLSARAAMILESAAGPLASAGVGMSCGHAGGNWVLSFKPDGTGGVSWNNFETKCALADAQGLYFQRVSLHGPILFTWTVRDRGAGSATYDKVEVALTYKVEGAGGGFSNTTAFAPPNPRTSGFAYQCTRTDLMIQGVYSLNHREPAHTRMGAPTAPTP